MCRTDEQNCEMFTLGHWVTTASHSTNCLQYATNITQQTLHSALSQPPAVTDVNVLQTSHNKHCTQRCHNHQQLLTSIRYKHHTTNTALSAVTTTSSYCCQYATNITQQTLHSALSQPPAVTDVNMLQTSHNKHCTQHCHNHQQLLTSIRYKHHTTNTALRAVTATSSYWRQYATNITQQTPVSYTHLTLPTIYSV